MKSLIALLSALLLTACCSVDVSGNPTTSNATITGSTTVAPLPLINVVRDDAFANMIVPYAFGPAEPSMRLRFNSTQDVQHAGLSLKDVGVGAWTDVALVTIDDGTQLFYAQLDAATLTANFTDLPIMITAGVTTNETVHVTYHTKASSTGNQHRFVVESPGDILFDQGAEVDASFPIVGVTHTISNSPSVVFTTAYEGAPASVQACGEQSLFQYEAASLGDELQIFTQRFRIESTDGGMVRGSGGTPYVTNVTLRNVETSQTMMGPIELDSMVVLPGATIGELPFFDLFWMSASEVLRLEVVASIACTEDSGGELMGHSYRVVKYPANNTEVLDVTFSDMVPPEATSPITEMAGGTFIITP